MSTTSGCLKMLLRRDAEQLYRMLITANFDWTLVAAIVDFGIIKVVSEALVRSSEKLRFSNACSHGKNVWVNAMSLASMLWLVIT